MLFRSLMKRLLLDRNVGMADKIDGYFNVGQGNYFIAVGALHLLGEGSVLDLLRKRGAKAIEAVGTDFDPRIHESVMLESSDAHREGEVIAEFRRGYMLGDRLLRPSMVKVAKA